jgi:hypothetical protein
MTTYKVKALKQLINVVSYENKEYYKMSNKCSLTDHSSFVAENIIDNNENKMIQSFLNELGYDSCNNDNNEYTFWNLIDYIETEYKILESKRSK